MTTFTKDRIEKLHYYLDLLKRQVKSYLDLGNDSGTELGKFFAVRYEVLQRISTYVAVVEPGDSILDVLENISHIIGESHAEIDAECDDSRHVTSYMTAKEVYTFVNLLGDL